MQKWEIDLLLTCLLIIFILCVCITFLYWFQSITEKMHREAAEAIRQFNYYQAQQRNSQSLSEH